MDILKDIEKNFLKINIYDKNADNAKLNIIKKQISDYFKYKSDENNIVMLKKQKYEDDYKKAREINNYNYELFLERKDELHQIFKETKTLASLYDYINYKNKDYADIPDIYTYEHISFEERKEQAADIPSKMKKKDAADKEPKKKKDSADKEPKKKKDAADKEPKKKKDSADKEPKKKKDSADKEPKKKDSADKEPKKKKDAADKEPKKKKDAADKEPTKKKDAADKAAVVKVKECKEGKILNPITNRCIKDVNYKPKPK
jgi:hypothetical protein